MVTPGGPPFQRKCDFEQSLRAIPGIAIRRHRHCEHSIPVRGRVGAVSRSISAGSFHSLTFCVGVNENFVARLCLGPKTGFEEGKVELMLICGSS